MTRRTTPARKYDSAVDGLLALGKSSNEAMIKDRILKLLDMDDINYNLEYRSSAGPTDIHLMHRCTIIETKTTKRLDKGPYEAGSGSRKTQSKEDESAYDQLVRYVNAIKTQRLLTTTLPWRGVVTDGRKWWVWEWRDTNGDHTRSEIRICGGWEGRIISHDNAADLINILQRDHPGKPWAPANPTYLFKDALIALQDIYAQNKVLPNTKIQKELWSEQLKASGNHPTDAVDSDNLFVTHTLLILISRLVSGIRIPNDRSLQKSPLTTGFVGWVDNSKKFLKNLQSIVNRYDWEAIEGDVMRALYIDLVPKKQRKLYGEYYTPDWLAEKICDEVLDVGYINEQLSRYLDNKQLQGIVDPACGSGTFLYQAARRLYRSEPVLNSGLGSSDIADFLCKILIGVDIHPVAVEMSIANVKRVLGDVDISKLRIYQGDSLLSERSTTTIYSAGMNRMTIHAHGEVLSLPLSILDKQKHIDLFVSSARDKKPMPKIIEANLDQNDSDTLRTAYKGMIKIIEKLGNGVWAWYIRNQAAPHFLSQDLRPKRIVSNPPWVRNAHITSVERKKRILKLGQETDTYVGGKMANVFDLASVFVARCTSLYLTSDGKAGWVLPDAASYGKGQWDKLRKKYNDRTLRFLSLGALPFPKQGPACVMLINVKPGPNMIFKARKGQSVKQYDSWESAEKKIIAKTDRLPNTKLKKMGDLPSAWIESPTKAIARQGATIVPNVLIRVEPNSVEKNPHSNTVTLRTAPSVHAPWKNLRVQEATVPSSWIKKCIMGRNLLPFSIHGHVSCIIPINRKGHWIIERSKTQYWKNASALYASNRGVGSTTPKTLEAQLDFKSKLRLQAGIKLPFVVYNRAGTRLCASVVNEFAYIDSTLYRVPCTSADEACFLAAVLNCDFLQPAFTKSKGGMRDYHTYFWWNVPIPRYDKNIAEHKRLVQLATIANLKVGSFVKKSAKPTRAKIIKMLHDESVITQIDSAVEEIISKTSVWKSTKNIPSSD